MRTPRHSPGKEKGIAVITAILIAAMVASLAFALSARERLWLSQTENRNDLAAAQAVAFAAIDLGRLTLRDDMRNTQVDHLLETWTIPVPPINVEAGQAGGRLSEVQGRFNLFNVQSGGKVNEAGLAALQRLMATRNLPMDWAEKVARTIASQAAPLEAQQAELQKQNHPRKKLLPVATLSELADLSGIDAGKLAALEQLVVLLPESTVVNVNFATPEVLVAVTPGLTLGEADRVVSQRAKTYFKSVQEYLNALPERLRATTTASAYCVESQYFLSEVESRFGHAHVRYLALIFRQRSKMPETVWVRRG